ncbi:MAG TPA: CBS domain-containing protein [Bacteroidetes bacterium]|nr:CBS domain-containing protein [Bacteroidota bacterium]
MEHVKAGDIMVPLDQYPHIPYWFTIRQAVAEIEKAAIAVSGRSSLPRVVLIFDEAYRLLGMARRRDILRGLEPEFLTDEGDAHGRQPYKFEVDPNLTDLMSDQLVRKLRECGERPISEVMRPIQVTVSTVDPILKVMYEMVHHDESLLPVLDEGKIVGVVRTVDVLHEVSKILL